MRARTPNPQRQTTSSRESAVSLTSQLGSKQSAVRRFFDAEVGPAKPVCQAANRQLRGLWVSGGPPVAPVGGADSGLVGMAVEFVMAAAAGERREAHIAGALTPELADQRAFAQLEALDELLRQFKAGMPTGDSLARAADCALVLARLEQGYRTQQFASIPDPAVAQPEGLDAVIAATQATHATRVDLLQLLDAALQDNRDLYRAKSLHVNPGFMLSSALGGADADLIADGLLIDFKATRDRSVVRSVDIYQLLGYALADLVNEYGIHSVGISALRWRATVQWPVDRLLHDLSGQKRSLMEWRKRFAAALPPRRVNRALAWHARRLESGEVRENR